MPCVNKKGKPIRYKRTLTQCRVCGKEVRKVFPGAGKPQRCRSCKIEFHRLHPEYKPAYKTGRTKTVHGYITVLASLHPNANAAGRVLEHRLVMEKKLGRYLKRNEVCHHINGKRDDNRPENLVLCQSYKEHSSYHKRPPCMICGKPHTGRGLCRHHYRKWQMLNFPSRGLCINGKWFKPLPKFQNSKHTH